MEFLQSLGMHIIDPENTFIVLLIIMVGIWSAGRAFAKMHLPPILGEILAGILLGPAFLGIVHETEAIKVMAELGIFFIMFHSGLDTDPRELLKSSKESIIIAISGVVVLFGLGTTVMYLLHFPFMTSVFMGVILSVTSFPVISRILKDLKINKTPIGHTILGSTVVDDIVVFILVSVVFGIVQSGEINLWIVIFVLLKVLMFCFGTLLLGSKVLPRFKGILNNRGSKGFTFSLIVALVFGVFAELIGLHMILGAYLGGIFLREEIENKQMFQKIEDRYFGIAHSFLGPIFFASIGMMVSFDILKTDIFLVCLLIAVVFFGQWIGSGGAAYFAGKYSLREASAIAFGLSGRGVVEIILAKIGYDTFIMLQNGQTERLVTQDLFSMVIIIAVVTTFVSPFLLKMFLPEKYKEAS